MFSALPKPVIFAHRGASSHAPENTLAAFLLAVDQGAQAIELDVQLTSDQKIVVFHDSTLERTTDGHGRLGDHSLAELKRLNAGINFAPAYQGEQIPTLAEVFSILPEEILINIELKDLSSPFDQLPELTAEMIHAYQAEERVLVSSFNPLALKRFQQHLPGISCGRLLYNRFSIKLFELLPPLTAPYQSINLPYRAINTKLVDSFHARGLKVLGYTLNHPQDMLSAVEMGLDGFFTDDPGFAMRLLGIERHPAHVSASANQGKSN